jgi:hypothetical protein
MKTHKRKPPIDDFNWGKLEQEDKKAKLQKNAAKKKKAAPKFLDDDMSDEELLRQYRVK